VRKYFNGQPVKWGEFLLLEARIDISGFLGTLL
jgi:hypothetical protein